MTDDDRRISRRNSTLTTSLRAARRFQDSGRKPIGRNKRLRAIGKRGKRQRQEGKVFGPLADHIRDLPCLVCGEPPESHPHHVRTLGSGHTDRLPNGDGNLTPLCSSDPRTGRLGCHDRVHRRPALTDEWDLPYHAKRLGERFDEEGAGR